MGGQNKVILFFDVNATDKKKHIANKWEFMMNLDQSRTFFLDTCVNLTKKIVQICESKRSDNWKFMNENKVVSNQSIK
jgi:hypothetical protein